MKTEQEVDQGMYDKGYRYKLTPLNADFEPLFTKTLAQLGPLMRDYKDTRFLVHRLTQTIETTPIVEKDGVWIDA